MNDKAMTPDPMRLAGIEAREKAATEGPWQVIVTDHPYRYVSGQTSEEVRGHHHERRIATTWVHGQLKDFAPVVSGSIGIGEADDAPHHMVSIESENAAFISHARADIPWLLSELRAATERETALRALITPVQCGLCGGTGRRERGNFSSHTTRDADCVVCKGHGEVVPTITLDEARTALSQKQEERK